MGMGEETRANDSGLEVVGRGVAVVLAAREVARLRPVARVVVLLAVEPSFQRVELLTSGRVAFVMLPAPLSFFWLVCC